MGREEDETKPNPLAPRPATVAGEAIRIRHALERLKAQLSSLDLVLSEAERLKIPPGHDASQALVSTTFEVVTGLAKIDAIIRSSG